MNSPILTPESRLTPKFTHVEWLDGYILNLHLVELASKHKPTFTGTGIAAAALLAQRTARGATALLEPPRVWGTAGGSMPKAILVSVVETSCLIADVHMPAMTGIELHKHLIEMGYAIPTILVTAYANDVDRARALNDGVVCYLRKPVDETHLMRCLRAALPSAETPGENS